MAAGTTSIRVPNTAEHGHDLAAMAAALTPRTRIVFVCNPNNPTGTAVRRAELDAFLDAVPDSTLVVLDEAYREFVTDPGVPDGFAAYGDRPNVVVLRTLSKAWGLAGLRIGYLVAAPPVADAVRKVTTPFSASMLAQVAALAALRVGYAIGHPEVIDALRKLHVPFEVNGVAQAAALASLHAEDEMRRRADLVVAERERVQAAIRKLLPEVPESQANFVWLPLRDKANEFAAGCERQRVIVRAFQGDGVRVTIGTPEENDVFLTAAEEALG